MTTTLIRRTARAQARVDSFMNTITGLNVKGRDRHTGNALRGPRRFTYGDLDDWYESDAIFAKIVDTLPEDMTREWVDFKSNEAPELAKAVLKKLRDLNAQEQYEWAMKLARIHGGAVVVLGVNDGQESFDRPINRKAIRAVNFLLVLDRWQITPELDAVVEDHTSPHFGKPEYYRIHAGVAGFPGGARIHYSRLHRFDGVKLPDRVARRNQGWGDSIGVRLRDAIENYHTSHDAAARIVDDFTQAVYKLKGLAESLDGADEDGIEAFKTRLMELDMSRSLIRALILDEDESFDKLSTSVTGLEKLLESTERRLTAESNMPHTKLLGESPGGSLSQEGTSQERQWFDHAANKQEAILRDPLDDLVELVLLSVDGPARGKVPASWSLEFKPLWQLDEKEAADVRKTQAETDAIYIRENVLHPEEVADSRFGGEGYSTDTVLDEKLRKELAEDLAPEPEDDPPPPPDPDGDPPPPEDEEDLDEEE